MLWAKKKGRRGKIFTGAAETIFQSAAEIPFKGTIRAGRRSGICSPPLREYSKECYPLKGEDALTKTYDLMLWLFPHIGKFPRDYRFILGDRMQNCLLHICGQLIEARFSKEKREIFKTVNIELDKLRYMVRLCKDETRRGATWR